MRILFYGHQGWSDIINCMGIIHLYSLHYQEVYLVMREDARELIDFFIQSMPNVIPLYHSKDQLDHTSVIYNYLYDPTLIPLTHGIFDAYRRDAYKGAFSRNTDFFTKSFYTSYGLEPIVRYTHFVFERNLPMEIEKYHQVITTEEEYILSNDTPETPIPLTKPSISLTNISNNFFDCILILERAKEIHLIDSSWACFCFILDMKYRMFQHIPITVYCSRNYQAMFEGYEALPNWRLE